MLGDNNDNSVVDLLTGSDKPKRSTPGSVRVPLNVRMKIPADLCALLVSRSGLAVKGITTQAGLVESDYRGKISAVIQSSTNQSFTVKKGQRITQALFLKTNSVNFNEVRKLMEPGSSHDGFGSTDADPRISIPH